MAPPDRSDRAPIDLLRREPARYRIEAITAHRNAARVSPGLRASSGPDLPLSADPDFLRRTEGRAGRVWHRGRRRRERRAWKRRSGPAEWVMAAISGAAGLRPTLAAVERGAAVALANKECLVCAGALFMRRAAAKGATVLPVDSEHNALFQALTAGRREDVRRVILTASGGPFRTWPAERLRAGHAATGFAASELVDGREGHDRFRNPDEQGPRIDRGSSSVRRSRRATSTSMCIRNRSCMAWSNSATARSSRSLARPTCASRSRIAWPGRSGWIARPSRARSGTACESDLRGARSGAFPGAALRARRHWGRAARPRQSSTPPTRSRSRNFWPDASDLPPLRRSWRPRCRPRPGAGCRRSPQALRRRCPLTSFKDHCAMTCCPKSPQRST